MWLLIMSPKNNTKITTFLPGQIQTNKLEKRFGRYRDLSGCNYNVSVKQILESEKKLRIRTIISTLPHELNTSKYTIKRESTLDVMPYMDLLDSNYMNNFTDYDHNTFMYVSGFACYRIIKQLKCEYCLNLIVKCKGGFTDTEYFDHLQRGGLIVPTENCIFLLLQMNALFDELRKDVEKRRMLQFCENPVSILVSLTMEGVARSEGFVVDWDDTCLCGLSYQNLFIPVLRVFGNILLNNYRKKINDMNMLRKMNKSTERKRKALQNKENMECSQPKKMMRVNGADVNKSESKRKTPENEEDTDCIPPKKTEVNRVVLSKSAGRKRKTPENKENTDCIPPKKTEVNRVVLSKSAGRKRKTPENKENTDCIPPKKTEVNRVVLSKSAGKKRKTPENKENTGCNISRGNRKYQIYQKVQ